MYYSRLVSPSTWREKQGRYEMTVEVKGVYPYLGEEAGTPVVRWVKCDMSDDMGNRKLNPSYTAGEDANAAPACTGVRYEDARGLVLTFNTPVRLGEAGGYSREVTGLPVYGDGEQKITFQDLFGNKHEQTVTIDVFGNLGLVVDRSETLPTGSIHGTGGKTGGCVWTAAVTSPADAEKLLACSVATIDPPEALSNAAFDIDNDTVTFTTENLKPGMTYTAGENTISMPSDYTALVQSGQYCAVISLHREDGEEKLVRIGTMTYHRRI